jgi:perosamine synthetase
MSYEPGASVEGTIPLCVPEIRGNEWQYVKECLDTNWVSSAGAFVSRFEEALKNYTGSSNAIATSSGTAALHIALLAAGVKPEDEVLVSNLSFIAPANAIRYVGAFPIFIDAEPTFWQMDPNLVVEFLEKECSWTNGRLINRQSGRPVTALLPVHILGHPVDIDPLLEVAEKYQLAVIEDATESLGARYKGRSVGHLGNIACFSFNGNKVITTGGGGMVVTDNDDCAAKARYLSTQAKDDAVEYVHKAIGYNYRLTNIQAALGCAQMEQLPSYVDKKRSIAAGYRAGLAGIPGITLMPEAPYADAVYWLSTILIDESEYGEDSRALLRRLAAAHIQSRPLWQPLHRSPAYPDTQFYGGSVSDHLNKTALSLPSSVGLNNNQLELIINTISERHG